MQSKPFDVFISHSSKDAQAASAIKQYLQTRGIRCWKAPDDIVPGESWPNAILRALENCHAMVLVWSSHSTASGEVSKELTLAMRNNLTVIPFRIQDIKASGDWEYHLANTHWMDAFSGELGEHLQGLAEYLSRVLPLREIPPIPADTLNQPNRSQATDQSASRKETEQPETLVTWIQKNKVAVGGLLAVSLGVFALKNGTQKNSSPQAGNQERNLDKNTSENAEPTTRLPSRDSKPSQNLAPNTPLKSPPSKTSSAPTKPMLSLREALSGDPSSSVNKTLVGKFIVTSSEPNGVVLRSTEDPTLGRVVLENPGQNPPQKGQLIEQSVGNWEIVEIQSTEVGVKTLRVRSIR
jgi:hypothetical protein